MRVPAAFLALVLGGGCGSKGGAHSVCEDPNLAPTACMQECDPTAPNTCPPGFHCNASGTCDAECTQGGDECGDGHSCNYEGYCQLGDVQPDANCPAAHFTPTKVTPSITLVLDRSQSMTMSFGQTTRFQAMIDGLFGSNGAVTQTQAGVYFGEAMYAGDQSPCLNLSGYTVARALNNASAMNTLTTTHPPSGGTTPTAPAIDQVVQDFVANPPPAGSPPVILLATDGEPNSCGSTSANRGPSIKAAQDAYSNPMNIRTFVVGLAGLNAQFLQDMANAGVGKATNQNPGCNGCAPYYVADDPTSLATAFSTIINGVLSCDLMITGGTVDVANQCSGTVTLNGAPLTCGTDWNVDPNGTTIHLLGNACDMLKASVNPQVDASFPCGSVVIL